MIRVEVLDSSPVYLCGLAQVLPRDGIEIVGMRCAPYDELALAADVYLMDTCSLQILGEEASLYVCRAAQQCRVLILTPIRNFPIKAYIEMGAAGSVSKQEDANTLARAIRVAVRPEINSVFANSQEPVNTVLSSRERQVLQYIASGYTHSQGVLLSERCVISGCSGHAARLRSSMVASS
ncbi:MAG: hypothetical protein ACRDPY_19710 [Streptosporangiaceae bacterium]